MWVVDFGLLWWVVALLFVCCCLCAWCWLVACLFLVTWWLLACWTGFVILSLLCYLIGLFGCCFVIGGIWCLWLTLVCLVCVVYFVSGFAGVWVCFVDWFWLIDAVGTIVRCYLFFWIVLYGLCCVVFGVWLLCWFWLFRFEICCLVGSGLCLLCLLVVRLFVGLGAWVFAIVWIGVFNFDDGLFDCWFGCFYLMILIDWLLLFCVYWLLRVPLFCGLWLVRVVFVWLVDVRLGLLLNVCLFGLWTFVDVYGCLLRLLVWLCYVWFGFVSLILFDCCCFCFSLFCLCRLFGFRWLRFWCVVNCAYLWLFVLFGFCVACCLVFVWIVDCLIWLVYW